MQFPINSIYAVTNGPFCFSTTADKFPLIATIIMLIICKWVVYEASVRFTRRALHIRTHTATLITN